MVSNSAIDAKSGITRSGRKSKPPSRLGSEIPNEPRVTTAQTVPPVAKKRGPGRPPKTKPDQRDAVAGALPSQENVADQIQLLQPPQGTPNPTPPPVAAIQPEPVQTGTTTTTTTQAPGLSTVEEEEEEPHPSQSGSMDAPLHLVSEQHQPRCPPATHNTLPRARQLSIQPPVDPAQDDQQDPRSWPSPINFEPVITELKYLEPADWFSVNNIEVGIQIKSLTADTAKNMDLEGRKCRDWNALQSMVLDRLSIPHDQHHKAKLSVLLGSFKTSKDIFPQEIDSQRDWDKVFKSAAKREEEILALKDAGKVRLPESKLPLCFQVTNPVLSHLSLCCDHLLTLYFA